MRKIEKCLEDLFKFMNWDKESLKEDDALITYSKRIHDKEEALKITSYDYKNIFDSLDDTFQIIFNNEKIIQNPEAIEKNFIKQDLLEYIEQAINFYNYVDIELSINKKRYYLLYSELKNTFNSFVFFPFMYSKNFVKWIERLGLENLEEKIFAIDKQTIFLINDCDETLCNDNVLIAGKNVNKAMIKKFLKKFDSQNNEEIARWRYEQVNWLDGTRWLNPNYFYFDFKNVNMDKLLENYFLKNTVNLIIPYISNYVIYENVDILSTINGHKKITIKIKELNNYNQEQVDYLFQTYKWAYTGKNSDKLSILRNLITILLCEDCGNDYYSSILIKSKNIYDTAIKNFDIYLKENVEQYFEARQRAMDLIENKSNEVSDQISNTIGNMNKTLFAFLGTIFTAIISFVENSNSTLIKFLLNSFIIYVVIYSFYYLSYSKIKVIQIEKYYNEAIFKMSDKLLGIDPSDNEGTKKYFNRISKNVTIFNIYWFITILINIVLIVIAYFLLKRLDEIIEVLKITYD